LTKPPSWIKEFDFYNSLETNVFDKRNKRIPWQILNASKDVKLAFLRGYNMADGLKSNPCRYEFKNFKTNSATLAAGLVFLIQSTTGQDFNITVEESDRWGKSQFYYSINLLSDSSKGQNHRISIQKAKEVRELCAAGVSQRQIHRDTGISRTLIRKVQKGYLPTGSHHLSKPSNEVKKIIEIPDYDGWFYDLETESGTFHCGIGLGWVHNSPRRGETFVTRKITRAATRIKMGLQQELKLGNLDAKRDWGYAGDFVEAMWLMLQQDKPDDYIIATGKTYSVRDCLKLAFDMLDLNYEEYVSLDKRYYRPAEVDILLGDPSKAKKQLGWKPKVSFKELVRIMVESDIELLKKNSR